MVADIPRELSSILALQEEKKSIQLACWQTLLISLRVRMRKKDFENQGLGAT